MAFIYILINCSVKFGSLVVCDLQLFQPFLLIQPDLTSFEKASHGQIVQNLVRLGLDGVDHISHITYDMGAADFALHKVGDNEHLLGFGFGHLSAFAFHN